MDIITSHMPVMTMAWLGNTSLSLTILLRVCNERGYVRTDTNRHTYLFGHVATGVCQGKSSLERTLVQLSCVLFPFDTFVIFNRINPEKNINIQ